MPLRVGIYVYPEVEVLDFAGPFEVFSTASRVARRLAPAEPPPFSVTLVAAQPGPVKGRGGFTVVPDATFADHAPLDVLLVPGGVHEPELERAEVIAWIARQAAAARLTASGCSTGSRSPRTGRTSPISGAPSPPSASSRASAGSSTRASPPPPASAPGW